jgi:dihydroflavonol-4-reductase
MHFEIAVDIQKASVYIIQIAFDIWRTIAMDKTLAGRTVFVTGSTGLLGSNLVRALVARGVKVKALARSASKAEQQFVGLKGVEVVLGDMTSVADFAGHLAGCEVLFHMAAYFRDSYTGGDHSAALQAVNIDGARALVEAAYAAGVRRMVHTSSIALLDGPPGTLLDETRLRDRGQADDYYRSKIDADAVVLDFLSGHPDMHISLIMPGWMHGPGDIGPTSAGQVTLDYMRGRLPGVIPGTVSFVDARDVAAAAIAAAEQGRRGERYLAAGRHMTMTELLSAYERVTGVAAPKRRIPAAALLVFAAVGELGAKIVKKPVLLSMATVRLMLREADRTHFNPAKSERELGLTFRPVEETLADEVAWYRANGWLQPARRAA